MIKKVNDFTRTWMLDFINITFIVDDRMGNSPKIGTTTTASPIKKEKKTVIYHSRGVNAVVYQFQND